MNCKWIKIVMNSKWKMHQEKGQYNEKFTGMQNRRIQGSV